MYINIYIDSHIDTFNAATLRGLTTDAPCHFVKHLH